MTDIENDYRIKGNVLTLYLEKRNGEILETKVDLDDFEKLNKFSHKWYLRYDKNKTYYAQCNIKVETIEGSNTYRNTTIHLHSFIMDTPKGYKVDHINHNTLDNRKENLRVVKNEDNTKNRKSKNKNNKSGYRNVSKMGKWWCVQLVIEGKNQIIKKFPLDQLDEAGAYAKKMRKKIYGKFAGNS